jgi:tetratricopeptide (TPR) repeat protein
MGCSFSWILVVAMSPYNFVVLQSDTSNLYSAIRLADGLRMYDVQYHDGGSMQEQAIATYHHALSLASEKRQKTIDAGEETNRALTGIVDVNEEITLDYTARSIDGIICALHTALGKVYFMSNMFEKAVESYNEAIKIEPLYLDAVSARGSSLIILGKYDEAATDFETVIERDSKRRFMDAFTGLARVLQAREGASTRGWDPMIRTLEELIELLENQYDGIQHPGAQAMVGTSLARLYHVLFIYHDAKTNDTDAAWSSLTNAYRFKMKSLPPWNNGFETQKVQFTKQIFHAGFWPDVGSSSDTPIFIIGFVRSGSTLLERILDAHPDIVGTGENSVFNGQLDEIRNKIVQTSMSGDTNELKDEVERLAEGVVTEMEKRWDMVADRAAGHHKPRKYVDKMLTNYYSKLPSGGIEGNAFMRELIFNLSTPLTQTSASFTCFFRTLSFSTSHESRWIRYFLHTSMNSLQVLWTTRLHLKVSLSSITGIEMSWSTGIARCRAASSTFDTKTWCAICQG